MSYKEFCNHDIILQTCYDLEVGFALCDVGDVTSCTKIMQNLK